LTDEHNNFPMIDSGHVSLRLNLHQRSVDGVVLASRRPAVAQALRGKAADLAVQQVPLIYALCGKAQGQAALLALAAARGVDTLPHLDATIEAEAMREHLWRLLLDLPPMLGLDPQPTLFSAAKRAVDAGQREALQGPLADPFWNHLMAALDDLPGMMDVGGHLLPVMGAARSLEYWPRLTAQMCRTPTWQNEPAETGAFARWGGQNPTGTHALAARWHARCAEVWSWAGGDSKVGAGGTASAAVVADRVGRSLVETARGLLMHEIELDSAGHIVDYAIVAPTEWNFHPFGSLYAWLHDRRAIDREALRTEVSHAVAVLDPCVRWSLDMVEVE
jgi:hypothetical protein